MTTITTKLHLWPLTTVTGSSSSSTGLLRASMDEHGWNLVGGEAITPGTKIISNFVAIIRLRRKRLSILEQQIIIKGEHTWSILPNNSAYILLSLTVAYLYEEFRTDNLQAQFPAYICKPV
nr:hypothetical protein HmN_000902300 [Hymenolepis microstoma]